MDLLSIQYNPDAIQLECQGALKTGQARALGNRPH